MDSYDEYIKQCTHRAAGYRIVLRDLMRQYRGGDKGKNARALKEIGRMLTESLGPLLYIAIIAAVLVCGGIFLGRKESNPEKH
jgi:hypothetical protein